MLLYINNERCDSVEQLQSYFTRLGEGYIYDDLLDYGRHGDISKWLREMNYVEYADGLDAIDKSLGDADFINAMSRILSGNDLNEFLVKKPYGECFSVEGVKIEDRGDEAEVMVSINVHKGVNESYEIKVFSNWGMKAELFNPNEHDEDKVDIRCFQYHRRAGKGNFGDVRVEVEGEKIEVGCECTSLRAHISNATQISNVFDLLKYNSTQSNTSNTINGHEYVDLGLPSGLKWATCNVGADSPEDYGDYFAWGETQSKMEYTRYNCATYKKRLCDIGGDSEYDAARANWGGSWRLPTEAEIKELEKNCVFLWRSNGVKSGCMVIGPNGNFIFLPAAGIYRESLHYEAGETASYWSSKVVYDTHGDYYACEYSFYKYEHTNEVQLIAVSKYRCDGLPIRPVLE